MTDQEMFDLAAASADHSAIARFGYRLWQTEHIPVALRKWGMRRWNARYRRALARIDPRLVGRA